MLSRFCRENQLNIADYYIDDGLSGLSFDRPDFLRLIDDIEAGLIDMVITKDLSRLGRDYIMTGYLTDIYFARMGVRYLAIDDGIDTQKGSNDIAPFKNIMNDMYAKDISRKIKSAKRQRAYQGMYISAQTPYGYKIDPQNHNHLIIDENVADVIRMIFDLAQSGISISAIASELKAKKIITPSVYKAQQGDTRFSAALALNDEEQFSWVPCTVANILHNQVYIGHMVNHKYEVLSYKTKEMRRIPTEERIIVKNTHEPIIDAAIFDQVENILHNRSHVRRHEFDNWLQGKVYCADCLKPMSLVIKVRNAKKSVIIRCIRSYHFPEECTGYRAISYARALQMTYEKIISETPEGQVPPELTKTLIRQRLDKILVGKRQPDGNQEIQIQLYDPKKRKRKFALSLFEDL